MNDFILTYQEIEYLIQCPKKIIDQPKKEMQLAYGHWRNDMRLQSTDGEHDYSAFMRKNEDFEENFSIGLIYYPRNIRGDIHLLRCNGPHAMFDHHARFHIHQANQANLDAGIKAEKTAYITKEYASYQDALGFFIKKCNILNVEEYFRDVSQQRLFPQYGGE